jgi:hypothetical protein
VAREGAAEQRPKNSLVRKSQEYRQIEDRSFFRCDPKLPSNIMESDVYVPNGTNLLVTPERAKRISGEESAPVMCAESTHSCHPNHKTSWMMLRVNYLYGRIGLLKSGIKTSERVDCYTE